MFSVNAFERMAVFISGGGSCLQALLDMSEFQNIQIVITNKKNIYGALKAKRFGIEVIHIGKNTSFAELTLILKSRRVTQIFLAGFMKIMPQEFIVDWTGKIFNIHPSLLPMHKGLNAFENSYKQNDSQGVTLHHVVTEIDAGKIILQKTSSVFNKNLQIEDAKILLQKTEQHLLREFCYRKFSLC